MKKILVISAFIIMLTNVNGQKTIPFYNPVKFFQKAYFNNDTYLSFGVTWVPTTPSLLMAGDSVGKFTWVNSNEYADSIFQKAKFGMNGDTIVVDSNGYKQYENGVLMLSIDKKGRVEQRITNTTFGYQCNPNYTGSDNVTFGISALYSNTSGTNNTAVGRNCLYSNTTGFDNTAFGRNSLYSNIGGSYNAAFGRNSLYTNSSGIYNAAFGLSALHSNTTGNNNTAMGGYAGYYNTTQSNRLYINSLNRTNILGDTTNSIIYGNQTATSTAQHLYLNAQTHVKHDLSVGGSILIDNFNATYSVTGDDTLGGSSAGNAIDIVTQYIWINCRTSVNTWSTYTGLNFTYDNDTLEYDGASSTLYLHAELSLGGATQGYEFRWYNVTDGAALPGKCKYTPAAYPTPLSFTAKDVNANTNDRYVLQVRGLTAVNDLLLYDGFIKITTL